MKVKERHRTDKIVYGLIFMDCSMPIMNGYDSTIAIRKYCSHNNIQQPKVFACTGHTEEEFIKQAWISKMDEVIPKPISVKAVREIIDEHIEFIIDE